MSFLFYYQVLEIIFEYESNVLNVFKLIVPFAGRVYFSSQAFYLLYLFCFKEEWLRYINREKNSKYPVAEQKSRALNGNFRLVG